MAAHNLDKADDDQATEMLGCQVATHSLSEGELAADIQTLGALSNDTRYEILQLITGSEDGHCVCELEPTLGVSQGAISQALSRLFSAGLVERRKVARWRYYKATPTAERLLGVLDEIRSHDNE